MFLLGCRSQMEFKVKTFHSTWICKRSIIKKVYHNRIQTLLNILLAIGDMKNLIFITIFYEYIIYNIYKVPYAKKYIWVFLFPQVKLYITIIILPYSVRNLINDKRTSRLSLVNGIKEIGKRSNFGQTDFIIWHLIIRWFWNLDFKN